MAAKIKRKKKVTKTKAKAKPNATKRKTVTAAKRKTAKKKIVAKKRRRAEVTEFSVKRPAGRRGGQSGDLQGLSRGERAESESVAELLEEGNAFEAEVLSGVEAADAEEREVETHEVPEDDVPGEYFDKD
jgi:hypothetical protein